MSRQGALLGLTLPLAAPLRYRGLRLMNPDALAGKEDMPLSQGFLLWEQAGGMPAGAETDAACEAPFPGNSYRAGVRAFVAMAPDYENHDGIASEAGQFWRDRRAG